MRRMRAWGSGFLENDIGAELAAEWEAFAPRPGEHPMQQRVHASQRWMAAWTQKPPGSESNPHAWLALSVFEASVGFPMDDTSLHALAAIDGGAVDSDVELDPEHRAARERAVSELRGLLARSLAGDGTEDDLRRISSLGVIGRSEP